MLNPHQTAVSLDLREGAFGTKMKNTLKVSQPRGRRSRWELELSELDDPSSWSSTSLETSSIQSGSHLAKKEKPCRFYDFRNRICNVISVAGLLLLTKIFLSDYRTNSPFLPGISEACNHTPSLPFPETCRSLESGVRERMTDSSFLPMPS